ncbi:MAG: hypothetical protein FJ271_16310 [Planctomycetes bacterium]|nr:hypothetical protein [Planctomycetota bacterium]
MPWMIGIDEAGYGPNLGPLVMTSVACKLPADLDETDLWRVLRAAVRRVGDRADGRLLIADSKQVYSTARGLAGLELGALTALPPGRDIARLSCYLDCVSPGACEELSNEPWFRGATELPVAIERDALEESCKHLTAACRAQGIRWAVPRSLVVCPTRFNDMLARWDTKGAVLGAGLVELLRLNQDPDHEDDSVHYFVDKHGGRNHYSALVQHALDDGFVLAREERAAQSVYDVLHLRRPVRATFAPRADGSYLVVALASMLSKYLREVLMLEFNRFWSEHVPGLKPTAGYPMDARRFYTDIKPAAARLGILDHALWRNK